MLTCSLLQWLLYLLSEDDAEVVVHGCKMLARVLVAHGSGYTAKFAGKAGGFAIMAQRLRRWWDIATLWPICFSILFGLDVAEVAFSRTFDFFSLVEIFARCKVVYGDALVVVTAMLQHGLREVLRGQEEAEDEGAAAGGGGDGASLRPRLTRPRSSSMELSQALESRSEFCGGKREIDVVVGWETLWMPTD
jgi:hypothetical protein